VNDSEAAGIIPHLGEPWQVSDDDWLTIDTDDHDAQRALTSATGKMGEQFLDGREQALGFGTGEAATVEETLDAWANGQRNAQ
jgi:hypothetical protein